MPNMVYPAFYQALGQPVPRTRGQNRVLAARYRRFPKYTERRPRPCAFARRSSLVRCRRDSWLRRGQPMVYLPGGVLQDKTPLPHGWVHAQCADHVAEFGRDIFDRLLPMVRAVNDAAERLRQGFASMGDALARIAEQWQQAQAREPFWAQHVRARQEFLMRHARSPAWRVRDDGQLEPIHAEPQPVMLPSTTSGELEPWTYVGLGEFIPATWGADLGTRCEAVSEETGEQCGHEAAPRRGGRLCREHRPRVTRRELFGDWVSPTSEPAEGIDLTPGYPPYPGFEQEELAEPRWFEYLPRLDGQVLELDVTWSDAASDLFSLDGDAAPLPPEAGEPDYRFTTTYDPRRDWGALPQPPGPEPGIDTLPIEAEREWRPDYCWKCDDVPSLEALDGLCDLCYSGLTGKATSVAPGDSVEAPDDRGSTEASGRITVPATGYRPDFRPGDGVTIRGATIPDSALASIPPGEYVVAEVGPDGVVLQPADAEGERSADASQAD